MKKILAVLIALTMVFGLAIVPSFADPTKPTSHDEATSHPGITSVTVAGTSAIFETDDNTGSAIYIRATLPSGTTGGKTEHELKNATVVITTTGDTPSVIYNNIDVDPDDSVGNSYYYTLNLFNRAYSVTVGSSSYTFAAGVDDGIVAVSSSDPLKLNGTLANNTEDVSTFGSCQNNPFMGNPFYSGGWTFISYFFADTLPANSDIGSVSGSLTVADGATLSVDYATGTSNYNFSSGHNATVTNGGASRVYYPRLSVTNGTISISRLNYDFNFTELKGDNTYYTTTIASEVKEIEDAWSAFLADPTAVNTTFNSGSTAMDVVTRFINWAETTNKPDTTIKYFTGTSETSSGTYLSKLDGLDASDCGDMAGFMYAIEPYEWHSTSNHSAMGTVGADGYVLSDTTYVVWFYTTNFMRWFNW